MVRSVGGVVGGVGEGTFVLSSDRPGGVSARPVRVGLEGIGSLKMEQSLDLARSPIKLPWPNIYSGGPLLRHATSTSLSNIPVLCSLL